MRPLALDGDLAGLAPAALLIDEGIFDIRIQFFKYDRLLHPVQEGVRQLVRERIGGRDLEDGESAGDPRVLCLQDGKGFFHIGVADPSAGDPDGTGPFQSIALIAGKLSGEFLLAADQLLLVAIGKTRENDPLGVFDEPLRRSRRLDLGDIDIRAGVAYPGGGPEDHRRSVGFRKGERVLDRLECLFRAVAVKDRDAGVFAEVACVLFRLG